MRSLQDDFAVAEPHYHRRVLAAGFIILGSVTWLGVVALAFLSWSPVARPFVAAATAFLAATTAHAVLERLVVGEAAIAAAVTITVALGLDHLQLTYYHNGIQRRLTDVHGEVVGDLLA